MKGPVVLIWMIPLLCKKGCKVAIFLERMIEAMNDKCFY